MSAPKSKRSRSGATPAFGASASSGAALAGGGKATALPVATEMGESGCIACGGSGHSHRTCVLVGAALRHLLQQSNPEKDPTDVVEIILVC